MTQFVKEHSRISGIVAALLVAGVVLLAQTALTGKTAPPPVPVREFVLDTGDAAFKTGDAANPEIRVKAGERIRFVLRNTDTGILHSITVPELTDQVRHVGWGQEGVLEVDTDAPGEYVYSCPQHCPKMRGKLIVE